MTPALIVRKIAIVAALDREVARLVKGWSATTVKAQNRTIKIWEDRSTLVACAGIGPICARIAAESLYQHARGNVSLYISAGFAGALQASLKVGDVVRPATVISDADGQRVRTARGESVLISAGAIASAEVKQIFAHKYDAAAVDMEAYSVGDVASIYKIPFVAIKAISDELNFAMPPLGRFVNDAGQFNTASFLGYAAVRPWLWPSTIQLGKNGSRAADSLYAALKGAIAQYTASEVGLYNKEHAINN